mmetsp:Transcript_4123/g.11985  ORF Transcript_4123/g.11985 Transcript_4123/m.11985 type:complete len:99 (+) Transcript_4123:1117-1413(+)
MQRRRRRRVVGEGERERGRGGDKGVAVVEAIASDSGAVQIFEDPFLRPGDGTDTNADDAPIHKQASTEETLRERLMHAGGGNGSGLVIGTVFFIFFFL